MVDQIAIKEECIIVRPGSCLDAVIDGSAVVVDSDGNRVFSVDESFSDEQVWQCLVAVNIGYRAGLVDGENKILSGVKEILRIKG